jgi:SPP1 family predicted phage head-tail adaptor
LAKQSPVANAVNSFGERTPTWGVAATVWAQVSPISARETERAKSFGPNVTHKVVMRYRTPLPTAANRLSFRGRNLDINGVINVEERNRELNLFVTEFVAGSA